MHINDTTRQMIREIIVELFREVAETDSRNEEVYKLEQHLWDIISTKVSKFKVNVYGVSLEERL